MKKHLKWNVYVANFSTNEIEVKNIFELSTHFDEGFKELKKNKKNLTKEEFAEQLNNILMYAYWSKCEYEITLNDNFPMITYEELQRINAFRKRTHYVVNIAKSKQVDVYDQISLNWDKFLDYVWENV